MTKKTAKYLKSPDRQLYDMQKRIFQLEKTIKAIQEEFAEFMSEPHKAFLEFFGISRGERIFENDGVGVKYNEIRKKLQKDSGSEE